MARAIQGGAVTDFLPIQWKDAPGAGLPLASPDMLYKERTPKTNLRGSENGGYLLSHKRSTIGVAELNDPVRNGKGWDLSTITT